MWCLRSFSAIFQGVFAPSSSVKISFQCSQKYLPYCSSFCEMVCRSKSSLQASFENTADVQSQQQHMAYPLMTKPVLPNAKKTTISYHPCAISNREEMINFMLNLFVVREPLMKAFGVTPQNAKKYVAYNIDESLNHTASFFAVNNTTEKMCGLRVNSIGLRNPEELRINFGPESNAFAKFMHFVEDEMDNLLNTERCMRHIAICVDPSASQCGVATELMKLSLDFAKKQQLLGLMAMCSYELPYILATKMGYKVVKTVSYHKYADHNHSLSKLQVQSLLDLAIKEDVARILLKKLP